LKRNGKLIRRLFNLSVGEQKFKDVKGIRTSEALELLQIKTNLALGFSAVPLSHSR
jgi:hypothetical protein